jgi:O-methyltransferase
VRSLVRRAVDAALGGAGLELRRIAVARPDADLLYRTYQRTLAEMDGWMRQSVFPDLPATPGRAELLARLMGTQVSEAFYLLAHLHRALAAPGDVCELGVAAGATTALMANELRATDRRLWLFDSFEGLPRPSAQDELIDDVLDLGSMAAYEGKMAYQADEVRRRLIEIAFPLERVEVVPGFIEETSRRARLPGRVCFAYVDFDFYEPIRVALRLLDGRIAPGGAIVVDDYGFFSAGAKTAVDEFLAASGERYRVESPPEFAGHFVVLTRVGG